MKKNLLWTMAAAVVLASCSDTELVENPQVQEQNAIAFSTYLGDNAQGRAVVMDKPLLGVEGFGVNAYYTKNETYQEATTDGAKPETFMANTKVTFNKDKNVWEYSPVKYWPNNDGDKVSFFAYGPHANGGNENNIVLSGTDITFTVANEVKNQVDLIYNTNYDGTLNQEKPAVEDRIQFKFDHALARIAFTVEAAVDEITNGKHLLDGNTRINVKKVALVGEDGTLAEGDATQTGPFYKEGTLSLLKPAETGDKDANGDAILESPWTIDGDQETQGFVFTAKEHFRHTVKDNGSDVMQLTRYNASEPQQLLNDSSFLMVIPQEDTRFKIYIEYDVISEGYDNGTDTGFDGSSITNKITSEKVLEVDFEKGKAYNFNLILGMTSVKFEADVTAWDDTTPSQDEWLPENMTSKNALLLNQKYNKEKNAFEIGTTEDLQALSGAVKEGAQYTLDKDGNPVPVVASRSIGRSGEEGEEEVHSYAAAYYIQVADIDLTGIDWEPIGVKEELDEEEYDNTLLFCGTYDAQSQYSITYALDGKDFSGIFRAISNAEIKGLTVNGTITNSKAESTGGIVGESVSEGATISNCHFLGSISTGEGVQFVGGIIGNADYSTTIEGCSNGATLTIGEEGRIGGIAGNVNDNSYIYACYNYGAVTANSTGYAGAAGIVGQLDGNDIELFACYNTGVITATGDGSIAGEIVSYIGAGNTVENNCYGGSNYAYDGSLESELINYRVGDGGPLQHWSHDSEVSTALNVMNNALAANGCEWKYVAGDETIKLTVVNETASEVTIPALVVAKENAKKGDLAMKDGTFLSVYGYTTLTDEQKNNCGGVVFWTVVETTSEEGSDERVVPASLTDDQILENDFPDCNHGLIVSLKDLEYSGSKTMVWQNSKEIICDIFQATSDIYSPEKSKYASIRSGWNNLSTDTRERIYGYQNTKVLQAYNKSCEDNNKSDYQVKPVLVLGTLTEDDEIESTSGWYLPSVKELHILSYKDVDGIEWAPDKTANFGNDKVYTKKIVDASIKLVEGDLLIDDDYWSSTEAGEDNNNIAYKMNLSSASQYGGQKSERHYVRAVCAF